MIFDVGEKIHIIERRYFESDLRRHFAGEIVRSSETAIRLIGYVWVYNSNKGEFIKKPEKRERVFNISGDNRLTINILPPETIIDEITYQHSTEKGLIVTDGKTFELDMAEFSSMR
jgi:hypothetical protein